MLDTYTIAIPAASGIDFSDADEIYGYQLLLVKIYEREGGLGCPPVNSATTREIRKQGLIWLREVKTVISGILKGETADGGRRLPALAAIPDLVHAYDFMYRICYGSPCFDFIRDVKLRTADRWLNGDKSISETELALLLLSEANRDIRTLNKSLSEYAFSVLGNWIDELTRYGRFRGIPLTEAYKRLVYLLNDDLFAYLGRKEKQHNAKTAWARAYLVDDIRSLDTTTLRAYIPFARTVSDLKRTPFEDSEAEYVLMAEELSSRPDLHPFYREAIRLGIETRKLLLPICYPEETA